MCMCLCTVDNVVDGQPAHCTQPGRESSKACILSKLGEGGVRAQGRAVHILETTVKPMATESGVRVGAIQGVWGGSTRLL